MTSFGLLKDYQVYTTWLIASKWKSPSGMGAQKRDKSYIVLDSS